MCPSDKQAVRRAVRAAFPGDEARARESALMCRHVLEWPVFAAAKTVGAYVPLRREADVTPLMRGILAGGKRLVLPRVEAAGVMTLREVDSLSRLVPGAYGIPEPGAELPIVEVSQLDLLIVPLEAIDRGGMRLGKGGGYYDRLLSGAACRTLGAVMSWQWISQVPHDPWDQPLSAAADLRGIHLFE